MGQRAARTGENDLSPLISVVSAGQLRGRKQGSGADGQQLQVLPEHGDCPWWRAGPIFQAHNEQQGDLSAFFLFLSRRMMYKDQKLIELQV